MGFLKRRIKRYLVGRQHKRYERVISEQELTYGEWIEKQEKEILETLHCAVREVSAAEGGRERQSWSPCRRFAISEEERPEEKVAVLVLDCCGYGEREWRRLAEEFRGGADMVVFLFAPGELSALCLPLLCREFRRTGSSVVFYGDEDVRTGEEGSVREKPWFKPDWSPDTFLSCFYFGSLAAVRAENLQAVLAGQGERITSPYELFFHLIRDNGGFERRIPGEEMPVAHISEVLFHGKREGYETARQLALAEGDTDPAAEETAAGPAISILIPSKDHPDVLFRCVQSILDRTKEGPAFEILVIDNGSGEENKKRIEETAAEWNRQEPERRKDFCGIRYHYEPMEFNFSRMCNIAARMAQGRLLLFLNDDMEAAQEDWLLLLSAKAFLPRVGAVGAKLLYPNSSTIQHVGVTNLRAPVHKLQLHSDEQDHYYGKNRGVHNMLAVTGACLMVRREVFDQAGGFFEGLAVAYNDVDLCYRIYEKGYDNVQRNDVVLYHHESLSRGLDWASEEKQRRLLREKDLLYTKHPDMYRKDPFYHKYLTADMLESGYSPASRYQVKPDMPWAQVKERKVLPWGAKVDPVVVVGMEYTIDIYKWKHGVEAGKEEEVPPSEQGYYFQGYSYVIGGDNACYRRSLVLQEKESGKLLLISVEDQCRQDIYDSVENQIHVKLAGFAARVRLRDVPRGNYRVGILHEDRCSRQKLAGFSNWGLQAGEG